jgi:hypothetical protein
VCLAIAYGTPDVSALHDAAVKTFLVYAALTLSFLGGARGGAELARSPDAPNLRRMVAAAMPTSAGMPALQPLQPVEAAVAQVSSGQRAGPPQPTPAT